jgi:hypothetical protein
MRSGGGGLEQRVSQHVHRLADAFDAQLDVARQRHARPYFDHLLRSGEPLQRHGEYIGAEGNILQCVTAAFIGDGVLTHLGDPVLETDGGTRNRQALRVLDGA